MTNQPAHLVDQEFDRQVHTLIAKNYPHLTGLQPAAFKAALEPLRAQAMKLPSEVWQRPYPFILVFSRELVAADKVMAAVEREGKAGITVLEPEDFDGFKPLPTVVLPPGSAYLLVDIDTGADTLNVTPNEAMVVIEEQGRVPLTLEEGVAFLTHFPEAVKKNHGFSLLASRCGDKRVTALWISNNTPKLGWCWAGNPHTWLGSASAAGRVGA